MHRNNATYIAIIATFLALASCGGGQTPSLGTVEGKATLSSGNLTRDLAFSMDLSAASKSFAAKADASPAAITGSLVSTGGGESFALSMEGSYYADSGAFELHGQGTLSSKTISANVAGIYDGSAFSGAAASLASADQDGTALYSAGSIEVASSGTVTTMSTGSGSVAASDAVSLYPCFYGTWEGEQFFPMDANGDTSTGILCRSLVALWPDGSMSMWIEGKTARTDYVIEELGTPSFEAWPDDTGAMIPCVNQRIYYRDDSNNHYSARLKLKGGSEAEGWKYLMIYPKKDDAGSTAFASLDAAKAATGETGRYRTWRAVIGDIDAATGVLSAAFSSYTGIDNTTILSFSAQGSSVAYIAGGASHELAFIGAPVQDIGVDEETPIMVTKQSLVYLNDDGTFSKLRLRIKDYGDSRVFQVFSCSASGTASFQTIAEARAASDQTLLASRSL